MNEDMKKYFRWAMHQDPHSTEGYNSFDTWGSPERAYLYAFLKDTKLIKVEGKLYFCYHRVGGGGGMGATPNSVAVYHIKPDEAEDI